MLRLCSTFIYGPLLMCAHAEPCITFMVPGSSKTRAGGGVEAGVRGSPSIRRQISTAPWWKGHACRNNARTAAPTERNTALNNKFFVSILLNESRFPSIVGFYQQHAAIQVKSRGEIKLGFSRLFVLPRRRWQCK